MAVEVLKEGYGKVVTCPICDSILKYNVAEDCFLGKYSSWIRCPICEQRVTVKHIPKELLKNNVINLLKHIEKNPNWLEDHPRDKEVLEYWAEHYPEEKELVDYAL